MIIRESTAGQHLDAAAATPILEKLATQLKEVPLRTDASIVVLFVDQQSGSTNAFADQFFPFALARPLQPVFPEVWLKHQRRHQIKRYLGHIFAQLCDALKVMRAVKDHLSGNGGALNALLLPLRNFRSETLEPNVRKLGRDLMHASVKEAVDHLQNFQSDVRKAHPPIEFEGRSYFKDDRDLVFNSPGRDRHGFARDFGGEHNYKCLLGSRLRMGGPFDGLFHFDCVPAEGRAFDSTYPNCHASDQAPSKKTHVNIAPNDAIR